MTINPLYDISKVYLEQIAFQEAKVDKLKPENERASARDARYDNPSGALELGGGIRRARRIAHRERDELNKDAKDIRKGKLNAPQFQGKTGAERLAYVKKTKGMKEALDPVGQEDADIDNDGDTDKSDKYLHKRRKAIGKAIATRKEDYSNWREDLKEVLNADSEDQNLKKIDEKGEIKNKVVINPEMKESIQNLGGTILEMIEIDEEIIYETVSIATEYFYEMGLNEYGVDIFIEELGLKDFVDFVFELSEEYILTEARRSGRIEPVTAKGTAFKSGKPTGKSLQRLRAQKSARREAETKASASKPSGMTAALQRQSAVANAKKQQPTKKPLKDRIAKGVLGALDAYQRGMERHRAATATAGKALRVAGKGASEFGKGVASGVKTASKVARDVRRVVGESEEIDEAKLESGESEATKKDIRSRRYVEKTKGAEGVRNYDAMGSTAPNWVTAARRRAHKAERGVKKEEFELNEKSESEQQQKLFGLALSVKRGDTPRSEVSDAVLKIVDTMSEKKIRDFAKTKHEGIPKKVEANEDLQPTTPQQFAAQRQLAVAQKKLTSADQISLQKKKKQMSGEIQKENTSDAAFELVRQSIMKKHGAASLIGTPENKAAQKANTQSKPKPKQKDPYPDDVYSRGIGIRGYRSGD